MISAFKTLTQPRRVAVYLDTLDDTRLCKSIGDSVALGEPLLVGKTETPYSPVSGTVVQTVTREDPFGKRTRVCIIDNNFKNIVHEPIAKMDIRSLLSLYFKPPSRLESYPFIEGLPLIVDLPFMNEPFVSLDAKHAAEDYQNSVEVLRVLQDFWPAETIHVLAPMDVDVSAFERADLPVVIRRVRPEKQADYAHKHINRVFHDALVRETPYRLLRLESLLRLHDMITHHRPCVLTRFVISGALTRQPTVFTVRLGTMMDDLRKVFQDFTPTNLAMLHLNSLLENRTLSHDQFAITTEMVSLHVEAHQELEVYPCIACGQCNEHCPVGILPSKIMHTVEDGIVLDYMKSDVCIDCGICSFYCPSKINVMAFVQKAKQTMKRGKS
ncbi:MAG: hypothetical protein EA374_03885 [Acholeplasmatales bacterium]|nr:MAG: hypothetical protein EA374_03885 [Acholeplasmatales bacterium]